MAVEVIVLTGTCTPVNVSSFLKVSISHEKDYYNLQVIFERFVIDLWRCVLNLDFILHFCRGQLVLFQKKIKRLSINS